jgi:hypothetical protein
MWKFDVKQVCETLRAQKRPENLYFVLVLTDHVGDLQVQHSLEPELFQPASGLFEKAYRPFRGPVQLGPKQNS